MNLQELFDAVDEARRNNPPETEVVLHNDDFDGEGEFISLEYMIREWQQ